MEEITVTDISFVIIGYNESAILKQCLTSVQQVNLDSFSYEIIYVDGGSQDNSLEIAKAVGVDKILGGDLRRRAAENRNLGFKHSTGRFIQFIDGDMAMDPDWPLIAATFLVSHEQAAVVCGNIKEINPSVFYQILQLDWSDEEGEVIACGGSAMWRRDVLEALNGFPETVAYGEEPFLCWRVRNELGMKINYLNRAMVDHDLGYSGFMDYWRRNVRCGETYAEIAHACFHSTDRLWLKETIFNIVWCFLLITTLMTVFVAPFLFKIWATAFLLIIIARKTVQTLKKNMKASVSIGYALHVYFSKIPLALGEIKWFFHFLLHRT